MRIIQKQENLELKPGTKTVFVSVQTEEKEVDLAHYERFVAAAKWFKDRNSKVIQIKGWTYNGFCVVKDINHSPSKTKKVVTTFKFIN